MSSKDTKPNSFTNDDELYYVFHYHPSLILAYIGVAVFAILSIALMQSIRKTKAPKFMMKVPVLAILECVGFGLRIQAINGDFDSVAIAMNILLLIAPSLLSLANFNCVIHVLELVDLKEGKFYYRPSVASKILTGCTLITSVLQGAGSGMISSTSTKDAGYALLIVGLCLQLLTYVAYIFILNYIHKNPKFDYHFQNSYNPKQQLVYYLYITTSAFVVRSIYRIIQYILLVAGHPVSSEWTFYIFDALMVAICFAIFVFIPNFFPKRDSQSVVEPSSYTVQDPAYQSPAYDTPSPYYQQPQTAPAPLYQPPAEPSYIPPYQPQYGQSMHYGQGNSQTKNPSYKPDSRV